MEKIGPVMLDIASTQLTREDKALVSLPQCGGVILFSRNFNSAEQVLDLTHSIREQNSSLIIAVDQEGGRVQRFDMGFSKLPPLAMLGKIYQRDQSLACEYAHSLGELMALEVQSVGCDISFAPVLDLGIPDSLVIGDRAFSIAHEEISVLGKAYITGMRNAGMLATGKHFPGHGSVEADSHVSIPYDPRPLEVIKSNDLMPFLQLKDELGAIMPAHIIYSEVDSLPAGFSALWLQKILREEVGFNGVIFSDDLTMKGAEVLGDYQKRAQGALSAGCDMVLVCNNRTATKEVMDCLRDYSVSNKSEARLKCLKMKGKPMGLAQLKQTERWQKLASQLDAVGQA